MNIKRLISETLVILDKFHKYQMTNMNLQPHKLYGLTKNQKDLLFPMLTAQQAILSIRIVSGITYRDDSKDKFARINVQLLVQFSFNIA